VDLSYIEQGTGTPVVFVHGAFSDARFWEPQREAIATQYRFIAYDYRYHGTVPWPDAGEHYSAATHAADLAAFIRRLNAGPAHLVGLSYGGLLASLVASEHPELARSLTLAEPALPTLLADIPEGKLLLDERGKGFAPVVTAAKAGDTAQATRLMFEWVSNQGAGALDKQSEALRQMVLDNARTVPLWVSELPLPAVSRAALGGVKAPTIVVGGELTRRYYSLINEVVARCIPGARLVIIPEATHLMTYQNPAAFNETLLQFLAQLQGGMADKAGSATHTRERKKRMTVTEDTGVILEETAIRDFEGKLRGELIRPENPTYEESRKVWNASISRSPGLIARCAGVADVIAAVRFARDNGLMVAVRSGGHSFPGLSVCDGGIVIDLGPMKGVRVDPEARTVRAQAGVLLGELDRETQAFGLAVPAGIVTHTGLAGLTLGGGIGWLMRKYGLTIDQLLSVDLVTAEGEFVKANASENADLFWGVRGGGGNFGIVTEFEFRLNPVGPIVLAGPVFWPMEESSKVLRFYRDWISDAPDELTTIVLHRKAPPLPFVPSELHGKPVVTVVCCYAGPVEEGEKVVRPLKAFGSPALDLCVPKPFLAHQAMFDPSFPHGRWYYMRPCGVAELTDDVIDVTVEHALRIESPHTAFPIFHLGGAVARVGDDETAFGSRSAGHTFNCTAITESAEGFDEEREWSRNFWSALEPYQTSVYVNFLMDEGEERIRQAYGAKKYEQLRTLKRRWDPDNFFSLNQNIKPAP
jgi:FAD/FMN-containing dehydrogenase/pimeloyl-ACP methyl ester carboxylesterase